VFVITICLISLQSAGSLYIGPNSLKTSFHFNKTGGIQKKITRTNTNKPTSFFPVSGYLIEEMTPVIVHLMKLFQLQIYTHRMTGVGFVT